MSEKDKDLNDLNDSDKENGREANNSEQTVELDALKEQLSKQMDLVTELQSKLKAANGESAERRHLNKSLEDRLAELEANQKKAASEYAETVAKARKLALNKALEAEAAKQGIEDVEYLSYAVEKAGGIETDEDGNPTNLTEVITGVIEDRPILKAKVPSAAQQTNPARGGGSGKGYTEDQILNMSDEELMALPADAITDLM